MNFQKLSYPDHQTWHVQRLVRVLDDMFFDVVPCTRRVLNHVDLLRERNVQTHNLKELYYLDEDKYLRFDHTHLMEGEFVNQRNFGPVFRKQPTHRDRYRQFHQYDVDYLYDDHNIRPLLVFARNFPGLRIRVSHTQNPPNLQSFLMKEYPLLSHLQVDYDSTLVRTTGVYDGLIFEIGPRKGRSICGGGVYNYGEVKVFGFGIGVNRLLNHLMEQGTGVLKDKDHVLVYYTQDVPLNLLQGLEKEKIPYTLKRRKKNLYKDYKHLKVPISRIIVVSNEEDQNKTYFYKPKSEEKRSYSLEQLLNVL